MCALATNYLRTAVVMSKFKPRAQPKEGSLQAWLMGLLASLFFAIPTALLMWMLINRELALLSSSGAFLNTGGFWAIIGFFICVAAIFPRFFPSVLGKVWRFIIRYERFW